MSVDDQICFTFKDLKQELPQFIFANDEDSYQIEDKDSEALFQWFSQIVKNNPDTQLIFSGTLHRSHRAYFHNIFQRRFKKSLMGVSQGVGENRKLHVVKVGKFAKAYDQLNDEQKQKVGQLFRWVKDTTLQYSRDEIAECILYENLPDDLQSLWDTRQQIQEQIRHLIQAAQKGDLILIQKIISENPQTINNQNEDQLIDLNTGETPLHAAAQNGQLQVIKLLVESGMDVDIMNDKNQSALDVAKIAEECEAEGLLIQLGAFDPTADRFPIQSIQQIQNLDDNSPDQKILRNNNQNQSSSQGDGQWGTDLN
eukprot:TRINITY_DN30905_c0_g1_i1.p1 TRINITY_DN30905_c0_g1~~TRINITY_DN30905_c0_g1_i1.p1  ORF type:complete len:312 (-),score=51.46 TRINITY_DN30905_c0_g1_i1:108-1043(-)